MNAPQPPPTTRAALTSRRYSFPMQVPESSPSCWSRYPSLRSGLQSSSLPWKKSSTSEPFPFDEREIKSKIGDPTTTTTAMAADREAGGHYRTLLGFLLRHGLEGVWREYAAREANALLWIALVAVTFLLLRKVAGLARLWAKGSKIPGPPSPSFFGHSKLVAVAAAGCRSGEDLTGYLSKLHEKYGPTVKLWLGPTQLLVSVKDVSVIKEMLIKAEDKLPLTGKAFRLAFGKSSIFVSSFEKVQKRRESLAAYMNARLLERVNTIPLKVVECVMGRTDSVMSKGILDCKSFSQQIAFYILGVTLFEDTFLNWSDATLYEELFRMIAKDACFWASYRIPPFWRRGYWRYQLLCGRLKHLTQEIIQKCRNDNNMVETKSYGKKGKKSAAALADDILSSGSLFHKEMEGHLISKEEPCGNILGVMFHGYLTIASLVCNILTRLVLHPELQEKIYSEIVAVQKKKGKSDSYDVQKMQFLLATVYESARLVPPGPLLQRCSLKHDLILESSINIPAGAIIVVPLQLVQMDNSFWGKDACQFNPHRFLSKAIDPEAGTLEMQGVSEEESLSTISESDRNAAFLPFGSGTRACIGQKFSILGISTLFASLLQNYELHHEMPKQARRIPDRFSHFIIWCPWMCPTCVLQLMCPTHFSLAQLHHEMPKQARPQQFLTWCFSQKHMQVMRRVILKIE